MTAPTRPISDLDAPLTQRQENLRWLLAHPEAAATGEPATPGERAEWRHLLHDADADDTTRPFIDLRKGRTHG